MNRILRPLLLTLFLFVGSGVYLLAQPAVPEAINFQAVVRGTDGEPLAATAVGIRVRITTGSATGPILFEETHTATTDDLGHVALIIGRGTAVEGSLRSVPWSTGQSLWMSLGMSSVAGGTYVDLGAQELVSVPYAILARMASMSDTSMVARDYDGVLPIARGGTNGTEQPTAGGIAYGDGGRYRFTAPGADGNLLVSGGNGAPRWSTVIDLLDSGVVDHIGRLLVENSVFVDSMTTLIGTTLAGDSTFITNLGDNVVFQRVIREIVKDLVSDTGSASITYEILRDSLLSDTTFGDALYDRFRDRLVTDNVFVDRLFDNAHFMERLLELLKEAGGTPGWSLTGNSSTGGSNFIGTIDAAPLPFRTQNVERMRITDAGRIGIGTTDPQYLLDVNGSTNLRGPLMLDGDAGPRGTIMTSRGDGQTPSWSSDISVTNLTVNNRATFDSTVVFGDTVRFQGPIDLPLAESNFYIGNAKNIATPFAPGSNGQVLSIVGGRPSWTTPAAIDNPFLRDTLVIDNGLVSVLSDTVRFSGETTVIFTTQPEIPLNRGAILVGNNVNKAAPVNAGTPGQILMVDAGGFPTWTTPTALTNAIGGRIALPSGVTSTTIVDTRITAASAVAVTYEDGNDTGFIFCQIIGREIGRVTVRFSAPVPAAAASFLNYTVVN